MNAFGVGIIHSTSKNLDQTRRISLKLSVIVIMTLAIDIYINIYINRVMTLGVIHSLLPALWRATK